MRRRQRHVHEFGFLPLNVRHERHAEFVLGLPVERLREEEVVVVADHEARHIRRYAVLTELVEHER
jgi:hypothetical protein